MTQIALDKTGLSLDDRPLYLLAGQIHYFRWPRAEWRDILLKAKAAGLNTIDTVIPWNLHEPAPGHFNFTEEADLPGYLDLIAELGLYAIVRPGPYICAEWENGGFPAWLTARLWEPSRRERPGENGLALRTLDERFWQPTLAWFNRLIPLLAQRQIDRGGPVILVQIENEHWASGVYGHDGYQEALAQAMMARGIRVPMYTCMGAGRAWAEFRNGWSGIARKLAETRAVWPENPLIVSELWSGWFDQWGQSRHNGRTPAALDWTLHELLAVGAAGISHWVWAGGTHFAYWGGRTVGGDTVHMTTSYDYDAPISEYGGLTGKYFAGRRLHLLLGTLGSQLASFLAGATGPGPRVIAPRAVPGRSAGGNEPLRSVSDGQTSAVFLQNPSLERQSYQLFLEEAHLIVEVEAGSIKPLFAGLPLAGSGLTLAWHTSALLGFWSLPDGDILILHGAEGEVGQLALDAGIENHPGGNNERWQMLDEDGCLVQNDGKRLVIRYWIGLRPRVIRCAVGDRLVTLVFLTTAQAEHCWPLGEHGFLIGPHWVSDFRVEEGKLRVEGDGRGLRPFLWISAAGRRQEIGNYPGGIETPEPVRPASEPLLMAWQRLDLLERVATAGWTAIDEPQPLEALGCLLGYGWYRAEVTLPGAPSGTTSEGLAGSTGRQRNGEPSRREWVLTAPWLSDRATVFVDGELAGTLGIGPEGARCTLSLSLAAGAHDIRLLVDNLGRFNYGSNTGERKGLLDTLYWGGRQEDISQGWTALWQEAVFAGEALANARPAHVRPDASDVDLGHFAFSGPSVWLLREIAASAPGQRAIVTMTGDRNPGALYVNGQAVARFSRHNGGGFIKVDITELLRPEGNVLALNIQNYAGHPWRASLLHYDPAQALAARWSFRPGVTPGQPLELGTIPEGGGPAAAFWRGHFPYRPEQHGAGPFKLALHGLGKGQVWLNGHNAGRFWQIGPQEHIKLPMAWLQADNEFLILEEQGGDPRQARILTDELARAQPVTLHIPINC